MTPNDPPAPAPEPITKTIVRFQRAYGVYFPGDVAGFEPALARDLIARGTAEYASGIDPREPAAAAASAPAPAPGLPTGSIDEAEALRLRSLTHTLNATDAIAVIDGETRQDALELLLQGEVVHPEYANGRKTVLEAIGERLKALKAAAGAGS